MAERRHCVRVQNHYTVTFYLRNGYKLADIYQACILPALEADDNDRMRRLGQISAFKLLVEALKVDPSAVALVREYYSNGQLVSDHALKGRLYRSSLFKKGNSRRLQQLKSDLDGSPVVLCEWLTVRAVLSEEEIRIKDVERKRKIRGVVRWFKRAMRASRINADMWMMKYGLNSYRARARWTRLERSFTKNRSIYNVRIGITNSRRMVEEHYNHLRDMCALGVINTYSGEAGSRTLQAPRNRTVATQRYGVISMERTVTITHAEQLMLVRDFSTVTECTDVIKVTLEQAGIPYVDLIVASDNDRLNP